ncbi:ABC transporter ATP-binding protein [Treponema endosymbiont of Eucomonympha sp.]|uniref:ABC transporter ATP-binding protein n=1 Tax=Treponema endosymbiont of Eucomonympha sp. TaxID=1580831 RepID=UPI000ABEEFD6|nr:ABC transporter ATP-binding protein [Treponema endosymbiont of Eucomonympha sp.]
MIRLDRLTKRYGDILAVNGVSFTAEKGAVTGILGLNGAGKTTLLKAVAAVHFPTSGTVETGGYDAAENPAAVQAITGYAAEQPLLYPDYTAGEFLRITARIRLSALGRTDWKAAAEQTAELCALGGALRQKVAALSRGYKQRLALAQALVHDPQVLVLDEPTAGLDPAQTRQTRELIRVLSASKTVLLSTHLMQEAEALCSVFHIIHHGRLALSGTKAEIIAHTSTTSLEDAFLRVSADTALKRHAGAAPVARHSAASRRGRRP